MPQLFAAVAETLAQVALRRLDAKIAFTAVLHTWTQLLLFHPHLHCIVPGGGLDPDHTHWISTRADFFLPVRVLAEVFRGKLLATLEKAIDRAEIPPGPNDEDLHDLLKRAAAKPWVVYCKPLWRRLLGVAEAAASECGSLCRDDGGPPARRSPPHGASADYAPHQHLRRKEVAKEMG
jgi:hypothetical protein